MKRVIWLSIILIFSFGCVASPVTAQEHPDRNKFHADVAHTLLDMNTTLDMIEAFRAQEKMPPDRDAVHEKAAHGFKHGLELFGVEVKMKEHADRNKFHADVAHSLLDMNVALDRIEGFRAQGTMPPDRDEMHEKTAHGFKQALELFGVQFTMPKHPDRNRFHADVAHALLEMNTTLDIIESFRAEQKMPPNRDEMHEKAAHGFKQALELFDVKIKM